MQKTTEIAIADYDYPLPDERIAKYPLAERDHSKLLVYRKGTVSEERFRRLPELLPPDSLLVCNNTQVIRARIRFRKESGALIEVFCLEPCRPARYLESFETTGSCSWHVLVGNAKRWKTGSLTLPVEVAGKTVRLRAEQETADGESRVVRFSWEEPSVTFAELLEAVGELPIPPYLHRKTETSDLERYQTVYSRYKGSVAAPTAGLHFTDAVFEALEKKGVRTEYLTLHVGAGTFKPVKSETIGDHEMHAEYISVERGLIESLLAAEGRVIAVGTTSVRTLESLYFIGETLARNPEAPAESLFVEQWRPYRETHSVTTAEALKAILRYLDRTGGDRLITATRIIIAPGYTFRIVNGLITNFHQPKSTLLLLVSAFTNGNWRTIYDHALAHGFRFLSYGDSSLLLP